MGSLNGRRAASVLSVKRSARGRLRGSFLSIGKSTIGKMPVYPIIQGSSSGAVRRDEWGRGLREFFVTSIDMREWRRVIYNTVFSGKMSGND